MRKPHSDYPAYARSERIADGTIHALGLLFALTGATGLIVWSAVHAGAGHIAALSVYGAALIATFAASAFYHMTPWERLRPWLRRVDHAAIYLKIAGTVTPLAVLLGTPFAYTVMAAVWALAAVGMVKKLFFWQVPGRFGPALYLVMGWMGALLLVAGWSVWPGASLALIAVGGLLYTGGVVFFSWESLKFSNAIWHGFVVAASVCFFAAIGLATAHAI